MASRNQKLCPFSFILETRTLNAYRTSDQQPYEGIKRSPHWRTNLASKGKASPSIFLTNRDTSPTRTS